MCIRDRFTINFANLGSFHISLAVQKCQQSQHSLDLLLTCSNKWPGVRVVPVASKFGTSILLIAIIKAIQDLHHRVIFSAGSGPSGV